MSVKWFNKINDITTTFEPAPRFSDGADVPEHFREIQRQLYPDLQPLRAGSTAPEVFRLALELAQGRGWRISTSDEKRFRFQALAITPLLRFRDDVVIEIRPEPQGCSVHMRSRSRLGRSDFGANHARIRAFLDDLKGKVNG